MTAAHRYSCNNGARNAEIIMLVNKARKENDYFIWKNRLNLNFWRGQRFPVVGLELVEFIKLQADVFDG